MACFNRVGAWPVVFTPPIPGSRAYEVIRVYPDSIEVTAGKPLGGAFAPRLIIAEAACPKPVAAGLPFYIRERPLLTIAHIADTQISDQGYESKYYGPAQTDRANFRAAVAEINALKPDLCLNSGDLVNMGERDTEWALYTEMAAKLTVPHYEVLGNHDVDAMTVEGRPITGRFLNHTGDREQYTIRMKGVAIHVLGYATDYAAYLAGQDKGDAATLIAVHEPLPAPDKMPPPVWREIARLRPLAVLAGHTHRLDWQKVGDVPQFVGSALGWTKTGDPAWNGYFIHHVYPDRIVSSFKRLGVDGLYFTTVVRR
jgi:predicted phosphodiesterase